MEERELAQRCRQGDNAARRELYEQYAGRLFVLCLRYLPDRETARDLLHDGFLKIYQSFDKFVWRGPGSLRAWMERVMANAVLQHLRKADILAQAAPLDDLPPLCDEPDPDSVSLIPPDELMRFVRELPAGYRTVFNLYVFEDMPHKEIARLLGINERSSASQLARAKAALAARVRQWIRNHE